MVTYKNNLKETEIILNFDKKQIKDDIVQIKKLIYSSQKIPFHSIFVFIPKDLIKILLNDLTADLNLKNISNNKNYSILEY